VVRAAGVRPLGRSVLIIEAPFLRGAVDASNRLECNITVSATVQA
jgi:hypothetical protein